MLCFLSVLGVREHEAEASSTTTVLGPHAVFVLCVGKNFYCQCFNFKKHGRHGLKYTALREDIKATPAIGT